MVKPLSVKQLSERLKRGDRVIVLDVREPSEIAIASLPGTLNIPMNSIPARADELPHDQDIVVMCHHGMRSQQVANYLAGTGFEKLYNLTGGIAAWSQDVDPTTPTY